MKPTQFDISGPGDLTLASILQRPVDLSSLSLENLDRLAERWHEMAETPEGQELCSRIAYEYARRNILVPA
jgi:hypothetical protein